MSLFTWVNRQGLLDTRGLYTVSGYLLISSIYVSFGTRDHPPRLLWKVLDFSLFARRY